MQWQRVWTWYRGLIGNTGFVGKLILLGLPFVCVCAFCNLLLSPFTQRSNSVVSAEARSVQATAKAIETENAQVIATLTATHNDIAPALESVIPRATNAPTRDVNATATFFAEKVAETQAVEIAPTIFYVVVTGVPTNTRVWVSTAAPARSPATQVPPTRNIPTVQTSGRFVASSEARKNYYCVTDPAWKQLKAALIWSDDETTFIKMGLVLNKSC